jgi:nucleoid-associated protein YgaU
MKRYDSTEMTTRWDGKRVYKTTRYPDIQPQVSDTIVISNEGEYLDTLAYKYYGDPTLWWVIALANGLGRARLSVPIGLQLRIPVNINEILVEFQSLNK